MMTPQQIDGHDLPALSTYREAAKWVGCSRRHVENLVAAGQFPKPVYLGERTPRFRRSDLLAWLDTRSAQCVTAAD